jgi:hypothetical protein
MANIVNQGHEFTPPIAAKFHATRKQGQERLPVQRRLFTHPQSDF